MSWRSIKVPDSFEGAKYLSKVFIDASNYDYIHFKNIQLEKNGKVENINEKTEGVWEF